ncbi:hypothetical protein ACUALS_00925 [Vibrio sp. NH-7]
MYKNVGLLVGGDLNVAQYKNGGDTQNKIRLIVPSLALTFTNIFSPLGYLALSFHFYLLIKGGPLKLILLTLLVSLNIPLSGMMALSRAFTVVFLLEYLFMFLAFSGSMPDYIRKTMVKYASVFFSLIAFLFFIISYNRFSGDYGYYNVPHDSVIKDPTLYSTIDYLTQWVHNGVETLVIFDLSSMWYGMSFSSLVNRILSSVGIDVMSYVDVRYLLVSDYASSFNGLVSTITYDFSPIGVLLFMMLFYLSCRLVAPSVNTIKLSSIFLLPYLLCMPLMFFMNNFGGYMNLQVALVYSLLFLILGKLRVGGFG